MFYGSETGSFFRPVLGNEIFRLVEDCTRLEVIRSDTWLINVFPKPVAKITVWYNVGCSDDVACTPSDRTPRQDMRYISRWDTEGKTEQAEVPIMRERKE